jgi:hypothetical protein
MNKKVILFFIILIFAFKTSFSQNLSPKAKIYVLTCSPGEELYQVFGHTAFFIQDSARHFFMVYHYGTFNFSDPNFYLNFIRGRLNYMLGLEYYIDFINEYTIDKRNVYMTELNLSYEKKNEIYKFLTWKSQPENRYYKYDFFMDNCATRVRGVIEKFYGDSLIYPQNYKIKKTYRQAITPYLRPMPWTRFGINLLLGLPADKKLDFRSAMFLPDYIDTVYSKSTLNINGKIEPVFKNRTTLINSNFKIGKKPIFNPTLTFWTLFIIMFFVSLWEFKHKKILKGIDFSMYLLLGIISFILLFMWFGTDHTPTKWNLNIIWAFPTHIWFAFVALKGKNKNLLKNYPFIFALIILILLISFPIFPQQYDIAMIPLFLIFSIRMLNSYYIYKK